MLASIPTHLRPSQQLGPQQATAAQRGRGSLHYVSPHFVSVPRVRCAAQPFACTCVQTRSRRLVCEESLLGRVVWGCICEEPCFLRPHCCYCEQQWQVHPVPCLRWSVLRWWCRCVVKTNVSRRA